MKKPLNISIRRWRKRNRIKITCIALVGSIGLWIPTFIKMEIKDFICLHILCGILLLVGILGSMD